MNELKGVRRTVRLLAVSSLILVALGGYVRSTGAGLACPDWPLCYGMIVPHLEGGIVQEYFHRVLAGIVAFLTFTSVLFSWRHRITFPRLWKSSIFLMILVLVQATMGGLTVILLLNPFIVTTHLLLGTVFFQSVALLAIELSGPNRPEVAVARWYRSLVGLSVLVCLAQLGIGGFVASSGASLVCPDFPLCNGKLISAELSGPQLLQMVHRGVGVLLLVLLVALIVFARTAGLMKKGHLIGVTSLIVLQILIGVGSIHMRIPVAMVVLHLVVAQLILLGLASFYQRLAPRWGVLSAERIHARSAAKANSSASLSSAAEA